MSEQFYARTLREASALANNGDFKAAMNLLSNEWALIDHDTHELKKTFNKLRQAVKTYEAQVQICLHHLYGCQHQLPKLKQTNLRNFNNSIQDAAKAGRTIVELAERITEDCKKEELDL